MEGIKSMEKKILSETVNDMILSGKKVDTIKNKDEIKRVFANEGIPFFDKVIDFQVSFGGIWYKIGERFYTGFRMDMFFFNEFEEKYELKFFKKENGKYYVQCMDYHYAGDFGPCIDEDGKIYDFCMGRFFIRADNIEEFLDDDAIKYYMVNKHKTWLTRGAKISEIDEFKKTEALNKIKRESFSDKYFEWWCNTEETIFVRIDLVNKYGYAKVYCKDQKILEQLYKSDIPVSVFPPNN